MKLYYAHPMSLYGSKIEQSDLKTLESLGYEIINPSDPKIVEECNNYKEKHGNDNIMNYFSDLVIKSDCLVFRSFPDGKIPSGIVAEIKTAIDNNKPVFELPCSLSSRFLNREQTKQYLLENGYY